MDMAQNLDGRLQVFALGFVGSLASLSQSAPNGDWGEWDRDFPRDPTIPLISFVAGQNEDGRLQLITNLSGILALVTQAEPGGPFRSGFGNAGISTPNSIGTLTVARNPDGTLEAATTIDGGLVHIRQHVPNQEPSPGGGWARHDLSRPAEHIAVRSPILTPDRHGNLTVFARYIPACSVAGAPSQGPAPAGERGQALTEGGIEPFDIGGVEHAIAALRAAAERFHLARPCQPQCAVPLGAHAVGQSA